MTVDGKDCTVAPSQDAIGMDGAPIAPSQVSGQLSDPFKNMCLTSQRAPVPLFREGSQQPVVVGGSQACADGMMSQDFITPADQFHAEYDLLSQHQHTGGNLIRQRSPAARSPDRVKRVRAFSPHNSQQGASGAGNCACHCGTVRKVGRQGLYPPCYKNAFSENVEEEAGLAAWTGQQVGPPASTGSRYKDDFKETGMLGQGSYCKVYSARHRLDGQSYAIKRTLRGVRRHSAEFAQFLQEVQILSHVPHHQGIIRYYSAWTEPHGDDGESERLFMQLELGQSTLKNLSLGDPMPENTLIEVARQVLSALEHLHAHGVAHMDIKPSNIIIVRENEDDGEAKRICIRKGEIKLADFGQATRCIQSKGQQMTVYEGDSRYLPLEVMNSKYDQLDKTDIFSLGATLFELASGNELPSGGQLYEDLRRGRVPLLPTITTSFMNMIRYVYDFYYIFYIRYISRTDYSQVNAEI